jgi:transcriptional regulator with XRE-family HTH domain
MKIAAAQAGYETTVAMAAALGVEDSTISRYWRGTHVPSPENMELYARVVGKPIDWFWMPIRMTPTRSGSRAPP